VYLNPVPVETRQYQVDATNSALQHLNDDGSTLIVMATGLGKTTVYIDVAKNFTKTLVIAHRKELIDQGAKRTKEQLGVTPGVEMASRHSHGEPIIFGSVQTLVARSLPADWIPDLIVIDEAHHSVASTYREVLRKYPNAKVLGVTATPDRSDQIALGSVFNSVAYRYETPQAIEDGWLAPIIWATANDQDDLLFCTYERPTIIFTPTVELAKQVALDLPNAGIVHGKMKKKEREDVLERFKTGKLQYMVNCNILTEGFDCPEIECVAMLRTIQSRGLWTQCLGRGLRKAPKKPNCLYLDLAFNPEHSLEGPDDALGGIEWVEW
jgi:superfamily II DNA or RNA helicase